ncbi:MAG: sulfatase [Bacteroidia bacterium]|nr:sulfatase [Bacteroidia bacterium]
MIKSIKKIGLASLAALSLTTNAANKPKVMNILLITADDLGIGSIGCFGGKPEGLTPNLNHFATEGIRFYHAHVNAAISSPSRKVLGTGLYGHNSGAMGFMPAREDVPGVIELFKNAGYMTGVLGKVGHSTPNKRASWDYSFDQKDLGNGRSPDIYYQRCKTFFSQCKKEGKPFYFMVNSHDPHRPFQIPGELLDGAQNPSKFYTPQEAVIPGFIPDLPDVRKELSYYQNSVRRLDDTFSKVMLALEESGYKDNTIVMFLSDNGISLPFAKCNTYLASTHTPWIVSWPGVVKPNTVDSTHFISGIDFLPTVLDATGIKKPEKLDGSSFIPLLKGQSQQGRDMVFTQIDRQAGDQAVPMRCIQDAKYGFIFTPWSDGFFRYRNNNEGMTMKAMEAAAQTDKNIAERVKIYRFRVLEELYNLDSDPDCLVNLIDNPEYKMERDRLTSEMQLWMKRTGDPLLPAFENRYDDLARKSVLMAVYGSDFEPGTKEKNKMKGKGGKLKNTDEDE